MLANARAQAEQLTFVGLMLAVRGCALDVVTRFRCAVIAALITLTVVISADLGFAHGPQPPSNGWDSVHNLTEGLLTLSARYQAGSATQRELLEDSLIAAAAARLQALATLMETDPDAVVAAALPAAIRSTLPSVVASYLEKDADLQGTLEILHEDWPAGGRYRYYLHSGQIRYSLHLVDSAADHLLTGAAIRVRGVQIGNTLALGGSATVQQAISAPVPNTLGAQATLVMLVNFADDLSQPYTQAIARDVVFNKVSVFFAENSYQQTWLTGDVIGWLATSVSSSTCDTSALATQARSAAAAAGTNLAAYSHYLYVFPSNSACGWAGLSTVGGNPSESWINGTLQLRVVAHELGHGLGLWHSHALDCGTVSLGSACTVIEYGDVVDTMGGPIGFGPAAHFNAFQKERLGWLNAGISPPITTVTASGTYTIDVYELSGSTPKALKILKSTDPSTGKRTWYYVESRQALGFDAFLAGLTTNVVNGVLIHIGTESSGDSSDLINITPTTSSWWDPALVAAQSFNDPSAGVTITAESVTATGASVTVQLSTPTNAVTATTDRLTYSRGQTVYVTARVSLAGAPVANASVTFSITKSTGAVVTGTATTGADGTAVYKVRLRKQDPVGTYQAAVTAAKSTSTTTFMVQ